MRDHLKNIENKNPLSFGTTDNYSTDLPFIAIKLLSLLLCQVLDGIDAYTDEEYWRSIDSRSFVYCVSCILASLMSVCETVNDMNMTGHGSFFASSVEEKELNSCFNIISCGCLWLTSIVSRAKLILIRHQFQIKEILHLHLGQLAECILQKVAPFALNCLKCVTNSLYTSNTSSSCLRLCLSLVNCSTALVHAYRDISSKRREDQEKIIDESMLGGIDDAMLMSIDLDGLERNQVPNNISIGVHKGYIDQLIDFLLSAWGQAQVGSIF